MSRAAVAAPCIKALSAIVRNCVAAQRGTISQRDAMVEVHAVARATLLMLGVQDVEAPTAIPVGMPRLCPVCKSSTIARRNTTTATPAAKPGPVYTRRQLDFDDE